MWKAQKDFINRFGAVYCEGPIELDGQNYWVRLLSFMKMSKVIPDSSPINIIGRFIERERESRSIVDIQLSATQISWEGADKEAFNI
jgi:hypothetical protein